MIICGGFICILIKAKTHLRIVEWTLQMCCISLRSSVSWFHPHRRLVVGRSPIEMNVQLQEYLGGKHHVSPNLRRSMYPH
jgi:hypothetical protein